MKICAISDLHGNLNVSIDPVEVLFICGDIVPTYIQMNHHKSRKWIKDIFIQWINRQPVEKVFLVGGNHDFCLQNEEKSKALFSNTKITILYNEHFRYIDLTNKDWMIYGSPLCHIYGNWAFMEDPKYELEKFSLMPKDCDIVITHDAPFGVSDICLQLNNQTNIGNPELTQAIKEKQPKLLLHGHLHSSNHNIEKLENTSIYNVSLLDENYKMIYKPLYLEL